MSRRRTFLLILLSLAILAAAGLGFLVSRLDPEAIKERLEHRISDSSGLQAQVQGMVELHFLPPGASCTDIAIRDGNVEVLTVKRVKAGIALLPLLRKEVRLSSLALHEPKLSFRRDRKWTLRFGVPDTAKAEFAVGSVSVRNGTVRYSDADGRTEMELDGLDLEVDELRRDEAGRVSFSGDLRGGRLRIGRIEVPSLRGSLSGKGNLYRFKPLHCGLFGSEARGWLEVDLRGAHPAWRGELIAGNLSLAELSRALAGSPLFEGAVEMRAALSGEGQGRLVDTLEGTVRMSGTDLVQNGFDLDGLIRKFRASRDINLVDIGVYAFAGPVGALVSKGVDVAGMVWAAHREDRMVIEELVFHWSLKDGVARAEDVAFRTKENRLAFQGAIDLSRGRYDGLTLGLLNEQGCAELTEEIRGPLTHPTVKKVSMLRTLAESLVGVLRKGWEIIEFKDCRPFYEGTVAHPK